ncbi:MAG: universal stress protein, partial [Rhodospirillaceae bacterium]
AQTRAKDVRAVYDEMTSASGVPEQTGAPLREGFGASWLEETGVEEQVVAAKACRADLVILPRPTREYETSALMTLNAALMQSGRPVVAAPPLKGGAPSTGPFKRIALFWNGSTEATRAVAAAQPFFAGAESVTILRVEEEEWFAPTEDLEAYLARHGVATVVSKILPRAGRTGAALLAGTGEVGADLMVMGAYTRSKLRQLILGSVTGHVMREAKLPVLMCH